MTRAEDRDLLRRLAGEGAPGDAEQPLAELWAALEPPPVEPAPPGFAGRVMSRVEEEATRRRSFVGRLFAVPGRLAAASALAAGLVAGAGLGMLWTAADREMERAASGPAVVEEVEGTASASSGAADPLSGAPEVAGPAEEDLLALAVEAAGSDPQTEDPAVVLEAGFGADSGLAGRYLAALDALAGEPL